MITNFKIFERRLEHTDLKVGDFVIMKTWSDSNIKLKSFIDENIGKIVEFNNDMLFVKYDNIPKELYMYFSSENPKIFDQIREFNIPQIVKISNNKEDLEMFLNTNKYNI
jgi:hypothetical protein